uniref:Uncharacterized protein n=1 Tax=Oryza sativa subsp. japonica TaxID=39947 RepID=Q6YW19_ORYSJ|nr:hypothetical protein [Oryza sativa Japonica Group]BAD05847.1 hypothetical protein [Oryza sativa Japonica Group]
MVADIEMKQLKNYHHDDTHVYEDLGHVCRLCDMFKSIPDSILHDQRKKESKTYKSCSRTNLNGLIYGYPKRQKKDRRIRSNSK